MYEDTKVTLVRRGYTSISEFIRDAIRDVLYPPLTENGFTPEFEAQVLRAEKEPIENDIEWDGVTPFDEFVLNHPPKKAKGHASHKIHHRVLSKSKESGNPDSGHRKDHQQAYPVVST